MKKLIMLVLLGVLGPAAHAFAYGPNDITNFVICLNRTLANNDGVDVSDTTACLPRNCAITLTMSVRSAQRACSLGGCQLPRIILSCPGGTAGLRFRPSYLMCPIDSAGAGGVLGSNRVEVGRDLRNGNGAMKMADIPVPPDTAFTINPPGSATSRLGKGDGKDKECNVCHDDATPAGAKTGPILSDPLSPFDANGQPFVIDTSEPGQTVNPTANGTDGNPLQAQDLDDICDCIDNNFNTIATAAMDPETPYKGGKLGDNANPKAPRDLQAAQKLCHALQAYQAANPPK